MVERAPRDRRSFDILSVKKEAKLSASEANDEDVGKGDADAKCPVTPPPPRLDRARWGSLQCSSSPLAGALY